MQKAPFELSVLEIAGDHRGSTPHFHADAAKLAPCPSKGAYCIRPHNAWGWGAADSDPYGLASEWSSWEEAIDAHVKGLADGYGYTISILKAQKYCSSWSSWYNNTLAQMAEI